jgi:hypothetical protein
LSRKRQLSAEKLKSLKAFVLKSLKAGRGLLKLEGVYACGGCGQHLMAKYSTKSVYSYYLYLISAATERKFCLARFNYVILLLLLHAFWCCKPFLYGTKKWAIVQKGN